MVQESDLLGFGRMVLHHLKKFRPNQYACLLQSGEVMDYCKEMEDYASAYLEKAQQQHVDYLTALEVAKETWLLLPDFPDDMQDSQDDDNTTPSDDNPSITERMTQNETGNLRRAAESKTPKQDQTSPEKAFMSDTDKQRLERTKQVAIKALSEAAERYRRKQEMKKSKDQQKEDGE